MKRSELLEIYNRENDERDIKDNDLMGRRILIPLLDAHGGTEKLLNRKGVDEKLVMEIMGSIVMAMDMIQREMLIDEDIDIDVEGAMNIIRNKERHSNW